MAGKIAYELSIAGLTKEILQLKELDTLLNSIGRKTGQLGGVGNINTRGGSGTTILPNGARGVATGEAAIIASTISVGASLKKVSKTISDWTDFIQNPKVRANMKSSLKRPMEPEEIEAAQDVKSKVMSTVELLENQGYLLSKALNSVTGAIEYSLTSIKTGKQINKPYSDLIFKNANDEVHKARTEAHKSMLFNEGTSQYNSPIGPQASKMQMEMMGFKKLFSMKGLKEAGGELGIGKLIGNFGKLGVISTALFIVFEILKKGLELLNEGIRHGAEAYQHAAKTGLGVGRYSNIESAFKEIGMEAPDMSILRGQFGKGGTKGMIPDTDVIMGAAKTGQLGGMQQMMNMAKEFHEAMEDGKENARQMGNAAGATQKAATAGSVISREWNTLLTQLAAAFAPLIDGVAWLIKGMLRVFNIIAEGLVKLSRWLFGTQFVPQEKENSQQLGKPSTSATTAWEKIGFVMKGPSHDYLSTIATNTSKMVASLNTIASQKLLDNGITLGNPSFSPY